MPTFTMRVHYNAKTKSARKNFVSVYAQAGDESKAFSYVTRNYCTSQDAKLEALRAIRQYHVLNSLDDGGTRVVTCFGESQFDDTPAFRRTPAKRIRKARAD